MAKRDRDALLDAQAFERAKGIFAAPRLPGTAVEALASEVLARLSGRVSPDPADLPDRTKARIAGLTRSLLAIDDHEATEILMQAHAEGVTVETLYTGYLAEAARNLGQLWEDDQVSSVEVVLAAARIYAIMRGLRRLFGPGLMRGDRYRAVFASVPGETHVLGVAMAADLLTLHGWEVDLRAGLDHDRLVAEVAQGGYPLIGLSASSGRMLFALSRLIVALRLVNPGAWIIVCGGIVNIEPEVASLVDADASAGDLPVAERMMDDYIAGIRDEARG